MVGLDHFLDVLAGQISSYVCPQATRCEQKFPRKSKDTNNTLRKTQKEK